VRIPKAGNWMIHLKQGLGFVMLAVTAYLIFLFPPEWHLKLIVFCLAVAFGLWLSFQVVSRSSGSIRRKAVRLVGMHAVIFASLWLIRSHPQENPNTTNTTENWLVAQLAPLHEQGKTVMVEFTADWCPNCKYVEKAVLKREAFQRKLKDTDTELIIADWTHEDPAITEMLNKLGSKSIPFTAIFPGDNHLQPYLLRDIYTLDTALKALEAAQEE
jgi:thiol:disulfide interchange protein DsbD